MLKIYICEDNPEQNKQLAGIILEIVQIEKLEMEITLVSESPEEILRCVRSDTTMGVFFLDIDLKHQMNGMELACKIRELQPRCFIIFVTAHSEMSYMTFSYKVEAMDFILKDNPKDLKNRVHQCLLRSALLFHEQMETPRKVFPLKVGEKIREIPYEEILYFEICGNNRKITIHMLSGIVEFNGKLKDIEMQLDERFHRCHRSCIVNKDMIKEVRATNGLILLENNETCLMSVRMGRSLLKK